jgi:hypothetical protein
MNNKILVPMFLVDLGLMLFPVIGFPQHIGVGSTTSAPSSIQSTPTTQSAAQGVCKPFYGGNPNDLQYALPTSHDPFVSCLLHHAVVSPRMAFPDAEITIQRFDDEGFAHGRCKVLPGTGSMLKEITPDGIGHVLAEYTGPSNTGLEGICPGRDVLGLFDEQMFH